MTVLTSIAECLDALPAEGRAPVPLRYFPDYTATNPYQRQMYSEFAGFSCHAGDIDAAIDDACSPDCSSAVFHLHWPEAVFAGCASSEQKQVRAFSFIEKLDFFRQAGGCFVWTIHNKHPHDELFRDFYLEFQESLASRADILHFHTEEAIDLAAKAFRFDRARAVVVPHGNYIGAYPRIGGIEQSARSRLGIPADAVLVGCVGQIRPYKGIGRLVEAFRTARRSNPKLHLLIAGKAVHPVRKEHVAALSDPRNGIHVFEGYIADSALGGFIAPCDLIALPYEDILTSGSVMLATSFGKPVVLPNIPALTAFTSQAFCTAYEPQASAGLSLALLEAAEKLEQGGAASAAALSFAEDHDWAALSRALSSKVRSALSDAPSPLPPIVAPTIGVAIVNYRSANDTIELIESLPVAIGGHDVRAYVVDNSEDGCEFQALKRVLGGRVELVRSAVNGGYAGGNNQLIDRIVRDGCEYVLVLNPDVRVTKHAIESLLKHAGSNEPAVLSPVVMRPDGRVSFAGGFFTDEDCCELVHLHDGADPSSIASEPYSVDALHGCILFFQSTVWGKVGAIPEDFFLYYEETAWCADLRAAGVDLRVVPSATAVHHKRSHGVKVPSLYYLYYFLRGAFIYARRRNGDCGKVKLRLQRNFVGPWREKIGRIAPEFVGIFDRIVAAAIDAGERGEVGRVCIGTMAEMSIDAERQEGAGNVDAINGDELLGWAVERGGDGPWEGATVWLVVDGVPVASAAAAGARPDVESAGFGEVSAFSLRIPARFFDGKEHCLELYNARTGMRLPWSSGARSSSIRLLPPRPVEKPPKYVGRVDGAQDGRVRGWLRDASNPGRRVRIALEVNGSRSGLFVADQFRSDLGAASIGDGCHAFDVAVPGALLSGEVSVSIWVEGVDKAVLSRTVTPHYSVDSPAATISVEEFMRWSFVDGIAHPGWYETAANVRAFFERNLESLAVQARIAAHTDRVSVIMPAFNRASVIEASIESVVRQSHGNIELIVIDDGSADDTVDVVKRLTAEHHCADIKLVELPCNRGVSAARNAGFAASTGDYIFYLDSDNVWSPEAVAIMLDALKRNPDAECVYAGQEVLEHIEEFDCVDRRYVRACPFNRSRLEHRNFIDLNVFGHTRDSYLRLGGFREDLSRLVDWELILRYTKEKAPVFVPVILNSYYVGKVANQITATQSFASNYKALMGVVR